ncbi:MAG: ATP-dependent zinc metalloprotease FtsH [Alphaproteobacteria bacterium]
MQKFSKNLLLWLAISFGFGLIYNAILAPKASKKLAFSEFLQAVDSGEVQEVSLQGKNVIGSLSNGDKFISFVPDYPNLVDRLEKANVKINAEPVDRTMDSLLAVILSWLPMILLVGVWIFFMRQMQGGKGGGAMGFGKSKARLISEKNLKLTFADIAGIDEAKEELEEIVEFLKNPAKFQDLGGKIPKGCLLVGPPGTGKTLLAKAIAGEAKVPFFTISGSDFVEMFVGVGASRVRDMFDQARKSAPCIVFIDEIDAVGRHRGLGIGGGNDEREQTLNQLLVEMDGFESSSGVIIIAATNRPDVLDPALLRPGRFDRQIVVSNPDIVGRKKILEIHLKKVKFSSDVDTEVIARGTPGFSGADLANLVNEAALLAARRGKKLVTMKEMEEAKDKVMMGAERKSMVIRDDEKKLTAYHEAGHAVVTINSLASDPIHKATIIPRGRALGMVMRLPEHDKLSYTRAQCRADLAVAFGGRVAEEIIFGEEKVTSGASSDIKFATKLATAMVREWGMSDKVGPIFHDKENKEKESVSTSDIIDLEIKRLVGEAHKEATKILKDKIDDLHLIAKALLEYETLSGDEIKDLIAGKKIRTVKNTDKKDGPKKSLIPKAI